MEKNTGKKSFTRSRLIKELSWTCELPQTKVKAVLEALAALARREAVNTLVLPGICKLEVVRRKPRKMRNPRTGESFMLPERDALRITAPRSLKIACAKIIEPSAEPADPAVSEKAADIAPEKPTVAEPTAAPANATEQEAPAEPAAAPTKAAEQAPAEPTAAPAKAPEQAPPAEPAAAPEKAVEPPPPVDPNVFISFRCPRCHQEVEASGDMVGVETECPACGNPITVPAQSEADTVHSDSNNDGTSGPIRHAQTVSTREAESLSPEKLKGLTIRIDVGDLGLDNPQTQENKEVEEPPAEQMISFVCSACKQEIEASRDMIGEKTLCPGCGAPLVVPAESVANTLHDTTQEVDPKVAKAMKNRTMRIDIGDDF